MIAPYSKEVFKAKIQAGIKIHTIRKDVSKRWRPGMVIDHWMHNPRHTAKNPHRFATGTVTAVQDIEIDYVNKRVMVEGRILFPEEIKELAIADGFDNIRQFYLWFYQADTPFEPWRGRLIHWTSKRY